MFPDGHLELRRISERPKSPVTSARESAEVGRHLTELQVPAMRGVHASPNYRATAVVLVVPIAGGRRGIAIPISIRIRVSVVVIVVIIRVAESESEAAAPEIAIMESTTTKFAESTTTAAETTIMECHATTAEAAMEAAAAKAAAMETATTEATTEAAAMASAHATSATAMASASATTAATATAASQRHRWRSQANRCNGQ